MSNFMGELGRRRLSQRRAAMALGMSQPALSDRVNGRTRITLDDLQRFAELLDVDPAELLSGRRWAPRGSNPQPAGNTSEQVSPAPIVDVWGEVDDLAPVFDLGLHRTRRAWRAPLRKVVTA